MKLILFLITATLATAAEFTTSLGDTYPYVISAITTDAAGNTYVVGSRSLGNFDFSALFGPLPATGAQPGLPVLKGVISSFLLGGSDVFVTKLGPGGNLLFTDTFAGKGNDMGTAITLDPSGNIYIAGTTTSNDFPLSKALQTQSNSGGTGFIIKLSNDGSTILYSTYFGGTLGATSISSLATDSKGNLYLTGTTTAADYPHTAGMPFGAFGTSQPVNGAIVASISAAGDKILYSGAIAGTGALPLYCTSNAPICPINTAGVGIAVDAAGSAYVVGNTLATGLPVTAGVLSSTGSGAFVAKVNAGGTGLSYLTFLTPSLNFSTMASAIAVDAVGNAYLAGSSGDLATTTGALQPVPTSPTDGFLAKLNPTGSQWTWATYLPGGTGAIPQSIAIDPSGNVWATGTNNLATFPNTNGLATGLGPASDFLVGVNASGSKLTYSALSPTGTVAQSVAVDPSGSVHVAGATGFVSAIAPTTPPTMKISYFQNAFGGNATSRISPAEVISIFGPGIGPATPVTAVPTGGLYPGTLGGVTVKINGSSMPLLYVSSNQINAVVPMEMTAGVQAIIHIEGTEPGAPFPVWIVASAPQAFPTVLNQDGTVNSQNNPAKSGTTITFYATGWQSNFSPLADGQVATTAQNSCLGACQIEQQILQSVGNLVGPSATVLYGGAAPGIVAGVTQFNVLIAPYLAPNGELLFNFTVLGPAAVNQSAWVAPL